ncbi:MAG: hypothetical protein RIT02_621 [Planctomycetota bacterium]
MTPGDSLKLERLMNQVVDGVLSDAEELLLETWLRDDSTARDRYLCFMMLHADLLWDHGAAASLIGRESLATSADQPRDVSPSLSLSHSTRPLLSGWLSPRLTLAVGLVLVGLTAWLVPRFVRQHGNAGSGVRVSAALIITLEALQGTAEWSDGARKWQPGSDSEQRLPAGTLRLDGEGSSCQLRFDDGTRITVSGDAEAEFAQDSQKRLYLRRGSLTADVARQPDGQPCVIETPTARIEVIGTVFTLVADSEQTALNVERGAVRMQRLVDGHEVEVLDQRQAIASLDATAEMQSVRVGAPPDSWRQTFDQPPPAICKGTWLAAVAGQPNRVRGVPCVASRRKSGKPIVHHGITARSGVETRLVTLHPTSVLKVRYRLTGEASLRIMLGTNQPGGSFGGNFEVKRSSQQQTLDADGWRTLTVPLSEFQPLMKRFPGPLDGSHVSLLMINSHERDVGLEVCEIEIRSQVP